jgi:tRNA-specific 2-thiouridylase
MQQVLVAMSGGLDSSVAAVLLLEQGYQVEGITLRLWREGGDGEEPIRSAATVCRQLGITHRVLDLGELFRAEVVQYFVREYARGRTPNPCLICNRQIKFGVLIDMARERGALLATGHYARVIAHPAGYGLARGLDERKDQSYFLYMLGQRELSRTLFPLGALAKDQVREMARQRGLAVAERPESQDVCFLADGDYRRFVDEWAPEAVRPGPIHDRAGQLLGEHRGLPSYTIGQREGLGIAAPRPLYVLALDVAHNALIVGPADALGHNALVADEMCYGAGQAPTEPIAVTAKIRYRARPTPATLAPLAHDQARLVFDRPLRDIAPGQAVVAYRGDEVLGGGIIAQSEDC